MGLQDKHICLDNHICKFSCSKCPEKFKTQAGLIGHNVLCHNEGNISELSCKICDKVFGAKNNLKSHEKRFHSDTKAEFQCNLCSNYFYTKHTLNLHMHSH